MKQVRADLGEDYRETASVEICKKLTEELKRYGDSFDSVLGFASFDTEVNLWPLYEYLWDCGKKVYFPVTLQNHKMDFYAVQSAREMRPGTWGILEPVTRDEGHLFSDVGQTLVIVPGLIFDHAGHRIGYGGGYYDTFLSCRPHALSWAVAFDIQIVKKIKSQPWDIPVDRIITESKIITIKDNENGK